MPSGFKVTAGRYEAPSVQCHPKPVTRLIKEAVKREQDFQLNRMVTILREEWMQSVTSGWQTGLGTKGAFKRHQRDLKQVADEVEIGRKATIRVRRRALALLLQADREQYIRELEAFSKTLHTQRL